jgi:hypothetical protein
MRPRAVALCLVLALAGAACAKSHPVQRTPASPSTAAVTLRVNVDRLFREHVFLAARMTQAALDKQKPAFEGAASAFEANARELAKLFKDSYGSTAEKTFLLVWNPYEQILIAFTLRSAAKTKLAPVEKAFAKFEIELPLFASRLNPIISPRAMAETTRDFVAQMKAAMIAQTRKDYVRVGANLRAAADTASIIAKLIASAIVDDLPASYPGDPDTLPADFRTGLNALLVEDVHLLSAETEQLLTGRSPEAKGTEATLDTSSAALAKALGRYYGATTEKAFLELWRKHVGFVRTYATNAKDKAKQTKALADLKQYGSDLGTFLSGVNQRIDSHDVERVVSVQVADLKAAIDAQLKGDFGSADRAVRTSAQHIEELAMILAEVTADRFPKKFLT